MILKNAGRLTAAMCALMLASCAPSTGSVATLHVATAPEVLLRACDWPRALPEEGLTGERAAALWGRDRIALATCARRHAALALHARRISAGGTPAGLAKEPE